MTAHTRDLSNLSGLSRIGTRAGITTGAILSGPSLASWFLERKLGEGYNDTLLMFDVLVLPRVDLTPAFTEPRAKRKIVLKAICFKEASLRGSNGAFVSWCNTRERFQEGIPLRPLGLYLWKLSKRRVTFSSLLTLMGEFPNLSAMADL